jgi:hypothetical protein
MKLKGLGWYIQGNYQEINILRAEGDFSHLQVPKEVTNMEREQARMNLQY